MKLEIENKEKFTPIELKITIESEADLCELWHRFNIGDYTLEGKEPYNSKHILKHLKGEGDYRLWKELDKLVDKLNLKKY